ncbi:MAG: DUF1080 domain-containing protein [Acidobacteriota bacterium]
MCWGRLAVLVSVGWFAACAPAADQQEPVAPAPEQSPATQPVEGEWVDLLAGGLENWRATGNPEAFELADGVLHCKGEGGRLLYYVPEQFQDFVFEGEVKLTPKANSGFFFRVADPQDEVQTGFEIQVLDSYGKEAPDKHDFGALYDIAAPTVNAAKPAGEWNQVRVTADGPHIVVELNGQTVVDVDLSQWKEAGRNPDGTPNKFKRPYAEMTHPGYLGIQDHGDELWFRNLRVKRLHAANP